MRKFLALLLLLLAVPAYAADNITVTVGTGTNVATKDLAGVHIPKHNIVNQAGAEMGLVAAPWIVSGPGTAGTAATGVLTVQGIASMTPILATLSGTNNVTNAGTFAVQIAANSSVNVAQINGVTTLMGNGATGTGSQRVTLVNDNTIPTGWPTAALQTTTNTNLGAPGATTCATDTGSCDVNAKLSRIAERITSLITTVTATSGTTITASVTRPADTTAYTANDVFANSDSAPTAGGYVLTAACGASGGKGILQDMLVIYSTTTVIQGEIWLFDSAVTAVNDNAAFALSDTDVAKLVGVVPFFTVANPSNGHHHAIGLNYGYQCVGTANLNYLIKIKNAPTPAASDVLTVRAKVLYVD